MISPFLVLAIGTCLTNSFVPGRTAGRRWKEWVSRVGGECGLGSRLWTHPKYRRAGSQALQARPPQLAFELTFSGKVWCVCGGGYRCLQRPEECPRSRGAEFKGNCKPSHMDAGHPAPGPLRKQYIFLTADPCLYENFFVFTHGSISTMWHCV